LAKKVTDVNPYVSSLKIDDADAVKRLPLERTYNIDGFRPHFNSRIGISKIVTACKNKTYNRRDSQMVTHSSTSRRVQCLCMAERTGCPVLTDLWSYVLEFTLSFNITLDPVSELSACYM
jgi:hypothetical protein